jgi:nitronate monooxygenase
VKQVHSVGGIVYHDVTARRWADKALEANVDGLICVNNRAGGHAGTLSPEELVNDLGDLGVPLICAGGIGSSSEIRRAMKLGYAGVQMGTRFIATQECRAHMDYKKAIVDAKEKDIVLTTKISGVPVSVIKTPYVQRVGTQAGPIGRWLLRNKRTKHWMRMFYSLRSLRQLKKMSLSGGGGYGQYYQAGKSVETIDEVEPVSEVMAELATAFD